MKLQPVKKDSYFVLPIDTGGWSYTRAPADGLLLQFSHVEKVRGGAFVSLENLEKLINKLNRKKSKKDKKSLTASQKTSKNR